MRQYTIRMDTVIKLIFFLLIGCKKDHPSDSQHEKADFYVSTDGNDAGPGTFDKPFASWQKGFDIAQAGNVVYIRGGIYYPESGNYGVYLKGKSGKEGHPISILAYPGESPVLDCTGLSRGSGDHYGIFLESVNFWYFRGLEIKGVPQNVDGEFCMGFRVNSGNNNIFELLKLHDNEGGGFGLFYNSENNFILNCDSYNNYDAHTPIPGGNADGFDVSSISERNGHERINTIRGCRSWYNSDDGFDFVLNAGYVYIDSCWSFNNGRDQGDGSGFKLGENDGTSEPDPQRIVTNCLAFYNRHPGFSQNSSEVSMIFYNNTSFGNDFTGFSFFWHNLANIFRNNVSYANRGDDSFGSNSVNDHNSWNSGVTVTDADFVSLDSSGVTAPRKPGGFLPLINFLKLADSENNELIDAGVNVGLPYKGNAPDLGTFECK